MKMETEYNRMLKFAETLKKNPVESRLNNYFNRHNIPHEWNYIISPYIVDFIFLEKGLVFELDGLIHTKRSRNCKDMIREEYLMSFDLIVLRFKNTDNFKDILDTYNKFVDLPEWRRSKLDDKILRARNFYDVPRLVTFRPKNFDMLFGIAKGYKKQVKIEKGIRRKQRRETIVPMDYVI